MKRLFLLMGMMALLFGIIASCSNDEPDNPIVDNIIGDTNSSSYQMASDIIDGGDMLEGFFGSVELGLELVDGQFGTQMGKMPGLFSAGTQSGDTIIISSVTHSFSNGWHVFAFSVMFIENSGLDTVAVSGTDSVKLTKAGVAMESPDSTFDAIYIRNHFQFDANNSNVNFTSSGNHSVDLTSVNINDSTDFATLNASGSESTQGSFTVDSTTCDVNITTSATMTNIVFCLDCADDCPTSGTMSATVIIAMSCENIAAGGGVDVNGTWTYNATIKDGTITQTFSTGNTTWTSTDECVPGGGDGGIQAGPALVRF